MRRTEMLRKESSYLVAAIAILILCLCMILDLGRGQNFSSFQVTLPDEDSYFSGTDGATMTAMRWLQGRSDSVVDICQFPRRLQDWATDRRDAILALETLNDMDVIEVTQADGTFVVSPGRLNRGPGSTLIKGFTHREWRSCRAPFIGFYLAVIIVVLVATASGLWLLSRTKGAST